jgi:hypothetical protein
LPYPGKRAAPLLFICIFVYLFQPGRPRK